jgi:hypothetical protein
MRRLTAFQVLKSPLGCSLPNPPVSGPFPRLLCLLLRREFDPVHQETIPIEAAKLALNGRSTLRNEYLWNQEKFFFFLCRKVFVSAVGMVRVVDRPLLKCDGSPIFGRFFAPHTASDPSNTRTMTIAGARFVPSLNVFFSQFVRAARSLGSQPKTAVAKQTLNV